MATKSLINLNSMLFLLLCLLSVSCWQIPKGELVYQAGSTGSTAITPVVLGQTDFTSNSAPALSASSLTGGENKIHSDGTRLIVADYQNHRVLIWNSIPQVNNAPADVVLGQPDFVSNTVNNGGLSASSLNYPGGVFSDGTKLYVADFGNHRVLIWNTFPTTNNAPADVVLGQPNMTSAVANNGGLSASSLRYPWHLTVAAGKLFVLDYANHRVLIWNTIPTTNQAPANVVLGQPNMTSGTANNGGVSASSLRYPYELHSDGLRLVVADYSNSRVLIWNTIPTVNSTPADVVLGQPNMTTVTTGSVDEFNILYPTSVFIHDERLFVLDQGYNRGTIWNTFPTSNYTPASIVFGQPDFYTDTANTNGVSADSLDIPEGLFVDHERMFVSDNNNNRLLILPTP